MAGYRVESPVVVRCAGISSAVLTRLRLTGSLAAVRSVIAMERACDTEAARLGGELYAAIGGLRDDRFRPALVGLRRTIHQGKRPSSKQLASVAPVLAPGLRARLDRLARRHERQELTARIESLLSDEIAAGLPGFRLAVAEPVFRHALTHSRTEAGPVVARWVADPGGRPPGRAQLARLAMYLSRATTKTSPYSSFSVTGLASWGEADAAPVTAASPVGLLELRGGLARDLEGLLAGHPELRAAMSVRVNPSAVESGGQVRFLGRPPAEPILTLRSTAGLDRCPTTAASTCTLDGLRRKLSGRQPEAVAAFLDRLIDLGLLELYVPIPDQAADPLGDLAGWLTAVAPASYRRLADASRQVSAMLREPVQLGDETALRVRLTTLGTALTRLATAAVPAGGGAPDGATPDGPAPLVAENVVYPGVVAELSLPRWRAVLGDLDVIRKWAALQDHGLPLRMALGAYCLTRTGPDPVPFLHLYETLQRDLAAAGLRTGEPWDDALRDLRTLLTGPGTAPLRLGVLHEVERLRAAARELVADHDPAADGVIRLTPARLAEMAAGWPAFATAPRSVTCYVQVVADLPRRAVVLNALLGGYGRGRSRWLALAGESNAAAVPHPGGEEAIAAECPGCFGTALNRRLVQTAYVIDYPFTVSAEAEQRRIAVRDLLVRADARTGSAGLWSARLGAQVRPVHTGMVAEFMLPPALQLLVRAFGQPTLAYPSMPLVPIIAAHVPGTVTALPRVDFGRVTVRRACWLAPADMVPLHFRGETDGGYLLRLHRFLDGHRLPRRCFVQTLKPAGPAPPDWTDYRKPLFIDFDNWFLILAFDRLLRAPCGLVVFTEAWPAPPDDPGERAREYIIELSGAGRG